MYFSKVITVLSNKDINKRSVDFDYFRPVVCCHPKSSFLRLFAAMLREFLRFTKFNMCKKKFKIL